MAFYIRLIWEFQGVVEKRIKAVPNDKGVTALALYPVSTTYMRAHIKITGTTLAGIYSRIKERVKEFRWEVSGVMISAKSFQENRWAAEFVMVIPVEENCEHASHLFANQTTTDGYGAFILLFRPKMEDVNQEVFGESKKIFARMWNDTIGDEDVDHVQGQKPGTREYRHLGGLNRFWGMYFWRHIDFLLQFCADRPFLKWKFFRKRMARVTVDEIAKRIVPAVCKKTCVAYGD
ncbi:hypothetical protein JG687_00004418 [Phytophthora cactorum]|uniref:Uncharacterized protein n=1 Tax=Phytophthora cactorum TaxID=29920 RepID=A0A8T1UQ13_9STRA|nr:hypothetical protein JG687_00004418 [Phytophthora cactorum]